MSHRLPVLNTCAPPDWRSECANIERPCNRYSCRYHLWPDTERRGRPHHGVPPEPKLHKQEHSCALDIVELNQGGMGYRAIAATLGHGMTVERIRQIEARAMRKAEAAMMLSEWQERAMELLGEHVTVTLEYPPNNDTGAVLVHYALASGYTMLWEHVQRGLIAWFVSLEPELPEWVSDVFVYAHGPCAVRVLLFIDRPESAHCGELRPKKRMRIVEAQTVMNL